MPFRAKLKKLTKHRHDKTDVFGPERAYLMSNPNSPSDHPHDGEAGTTPAPTVAAFSPSQQTASRTRSQHSVLIHQKSPLLVATPPQVTRTLAYSHPFILPLNHIAGLLSWTTSDPWESFLLLAAFWFVVLYGDPVLTWAGPVVLVVGLIFGMYSRRYSPLSSTIWSGLDVKKKSKDADQQQRKSLDEILDTLQTFTTRCDVLLDPFLRLTEYLSTQSSATSATTRPALTTLFIRILAFTPIWIILALPPLRIITTQRLILVSGTLSLSWHSRPARVCRTILWRSRSIRKALSLLTGLQLPLGHIPSPSAATISSGAPNLLPRDSSKAGTSPGVRFTFTLFENQRRWWGLGWTSSLLAYERQAWTDSHLNTCADTEHYALPETENASTIWRWVPGSEWKVENAATTKEKSAKRIGGGGGGDNSGWVYYDNKWEDGRKEDGWGRYTRRRKWVRDGELVERPTVTARDQEENDSTKMSNNDNDSPTTDSTIASPTTAAENKAAMKSGAQRKAWQPRPRQNDKSRSISSVNMDAVSATGSATSTKSRLSADEEDVHTPIERLKRYDWDRSLVEGLAEQLS